MLWRTNGLIGMIPKAEDGEIGEVADFLFDDIEWAVRYMVVDTRRWLPGRKVLLVPKVLGEPDEAAWVIPVALTREQVRNSPDIDADRPVSRRQEVELHGYYGWWPYWGTPGNVAVGQPPLYATNPIPPAPDEDEEATNLRSVKEVQGYRVAATNAEVGHVEDFVVDLQDGWRIRHFGVDTRDWLPGRHVLVAADRVQRIDWIDRRVFVDLAREQIEQGPQYDPRHGIDRELEARLRQGR